MPCVASIKKTSGPNRAKLCAISQPIGPAPMMPRRFGNSVSELNGLLLLARNSVVRVVCCDTEVQVIDDFHANRRLDPKQHKLRGGGGTDFRPVFEYAEHQKGFRQLIYLTDACGTYPETAPRKFETLWLVPHNTTDEPPFGEIVKMPFSVHKP
jgi:predicted metal-dependent peptidase